MSSSSASQPGLRGRGTTAVILCLHLPLRTALLFATMLCLSGQFFETAGILATPWGEVVLANRSPGLAVDGYGLPRSFAWAVATEDVVRWAPDRLFENGPLFVESCEVPPSTGLYWSLWFAVHHGLLMSVLILLNICIHVPWRDLKNQVFRRNN